MGAAPPVNKEQDLLHPTATFETSRLLKQHKAAQSSSSGLASSKGSGIQHPHGSISH